MPRAGGAPVVSGSYSGRAAVPSDALLRMTEACASFEIGPHGVLRGDRGGHRHRPAPVTARGTGGRAETPFAHIWELRGGRIVRRRGFTNTDLLNTARISR